MAGPHGFSKILCSKHHWKHSLWTYSANRRAKSHFHSVANGASLFPRWLPRAVIHVAKEEKNTLVVAWRQARIGFVFFLVHIYCLALYQWLCQFFPSFWSPLKPSSAVVCICVLNELKCIPLYGFFTFAYIFLVSEWEMCVVNTVLVSLAITKL